MKPKILFIADGWLQDTGGGGVKMTAVKLLNNFSADRFQLSVIDLEIGADASTVLSGKSGLAEHIIFLPIRLPNIKLQRIYIPLWPFFIWRILSVLKKEKPVLLCYETGPAVKVVLFFWIKLFFPHIPQVFVEHIHPLVYIKRASHFSGLIRFLMHFVYRRSHALVSVSQEMAAAMVKELGLSPSRVRPIYNPIIDETLYQEASRTVAHPWYRDRSVPVIVSVARLDPIQKDFPTLWKAFAIILRNQQVRLVIVGDGPQRKELEDLAEKLNIRENIWFAGHQENPYKFIAKSSILVLSSRFEAFGVVIVEAMACGIPVVASDCDFGPREIIQNGENGFLVAVGDTEKLADAIGRLLTGKELREQFIENGREKSRIFSVEKAVRAYQELFEELLEENK